MSKQDGGAAFPRPFSKTGEYSDSTKEHAQSGMSLRDHFAGLAMQSMCAARDNDDFRYGNVELAQMAYSVADAMLAERAK